MKRHKFFIVHFCISITSFTGYAQTAFLDSISNPNYVAWEYELNEVVIEEGDQDVYNAALRFYKSDPLSSSDDVMEKLVGIWAMKRGNYAFEPVMRGLSGGQINVTIDEMRVLGACTDKMDPITSYVEPNNLEQLNISQGATGFHAGSTVGGSFDMQIKKPVFNVKKPWETSFGTRVLSANSGLETLFNTSYSNENFGVRVGGSYRKGENYRAGGGEVIDHSAYNKANYSASMSYLPGKNDMLNLSFIGDYAWDVGYPALPMDVGKADANIVGLTYDKWFASNAFNHLTAKVYYNQVDHVMDDSNREVIIRMDMPGFTKTFGAFVKGAYKINDQFQGQMKMDMYSSFAHAEMTMYFHDSPPMYMLTWPDVNRNVLGFQNQTTYALNEKTSINGGFRLEGNSASMNSELGERQISVFDFGIPNPGELLLNANVGIERKVGKLFMMDAEVSYGQRMPNESEQYGFYLFNAYDGYDYVGRPDLKSEKSIQLETSVLMESNRFRLNLTGFYYNFERYILGKFDKDLSAMTIGANGVKVYENFAFAMLAGVESQMTFKWNHFEILNLTKYTYGSLGDDQPLPLIPPLKNNLEINYHLKKDWHFTIGAEAATKQDRINVDFGERNTPGYAIANCAIEKSFQLKLTHFKTNLSVHNIFDRNYYEHLDWGEIPRSGRNISFSILVIF